MGLSVSVPLRRSFEMRLNRLTVAVTVALAGMCVFSNATKADILLTVDLSVTDQVTILATNGVSSATVSGSDGTGVYLDMIYSAPGSALGETLVAGDLTNSLNPTDDSPRLSRTSGGSDLGLNIWSFSADSTVDFVAGTQAFTGSATWTLDPASYADMIAGGPRIGSLYFPAITSNDLTGATLIGEYQIIPEPTTVALLGLGGLALMRRHRRYA
jgi:hypothetical protein